MKATTTPLIQYGQYPETGKTRCIDVNRRTTTAACARGTKRTVLFEYKEVVKDLLFAMSPRNLLYVVGGRLLNFDKNACFIQSTTYSHKAITTSLCKRDLLTRIDVFLAVAAIAL